MADSRNRVLHIEDDPDQREIVSQCLAGFCRYIGVGSAEEAEQKLNTGGWQLIILDLALPLMNGFEFLRKNRRNILDLGIPVVITTGLEGAGIEVLGEDYCCSAIFAKPIDQHNFVKAIKQILA